MIPLNEVNSKIYEKFGLPVVISGQDVESLKTPYIVYDIISEDRYKEYQVLKKNLTTSDGEIIEYKAPQTIDIQYTLVSDPIDIQSDLTQLNSVYNYFLTDEFKLFADKQKLGYTIISPITLLNLAREDFFERQFIFEVRYFYANIFSQIDAGGEINTVNHEKVEAPAGL